MYFPTVNYLNNLRIEYCIDCIGTNFCIEQKCYKVIEFFKVYDLHRRLSLLELIKKIMICLSQKDKRAEKVNSAN